MLWHFSMQRHHFLHSSVLDVYIIPRTFREKVFQFSPACFLVLRAVGLFYVRVLLPPFFPVAFTPLEKEPFIFSCLFSGTSYCGSFRCKGTTFSVFPAGCVRHFHYILFCRQNSLNSLLLAFWYSVLWLFNAKDTQIAHPTHARTQIHAVVVDSMFRRITLYRR